MGRLKSSQPADNGTEKLLALQKDLLSSTRTQDLLSVIQKGNGIQGEQRSQGHFLGLHALQFGPKARNLSLPEHCT